MLCSRGETFRNTDESQKSKVKTALTSRAGMSRQVSNPVSYVAARNLDDKSSKGQRDRQGRPRIFSAILFLLPSRKP